MRDAKPYEEHCSEHDEGNPNDVYGDICLQRCHQCSLQKLVNEGVPNGIVVILPILRKHQHVYDNVGGRNERGFGGGHT